MVMKQIVTDSLHPVAVEDTQLIQLLRANFFLEPYE